jgi:hypothetical protein
MQGKDRAQGAGRGAQKKAGSRSQDAGAWRGAKSWKVTDSYQLDLFPKLKTQNLSTCSGQTQNSMRIKDAHSEKVKKNGVLGRCGR